MIRAIKRAACSACFAALIFCCHAGSTAARADEQTLIEEPLEASLPIVDAIHYYNSGERLTVGPRIVGGKKANIDENVWQVGLLVARIPDDERALFCGGSIVASRWILTAAHCVDRKTPPHVVNVLVGSSDLRQSGRRIAVEKIILHRDWNRTTRDSDLALLQLSGDTGYAPISALPRELDQQRLVANTVVRVTGWGRTAESGAMSAELRQLTTYYRTNDECNDRISYNGRVTSNMLCAGRAQGGVDACKGDSGGPLSVVIDGKRYLAGVVSWGDGCARPFKFGVYARVSMFESWLSEQMSAGHMAQR